MELDDFVFSDVFMCYLYLCLGKGEAVQITNVYSLLVHPSKGEEKQPDIGGTKVPLKGKLFKMLSDLFDRSKEECNIDICFKPQEDGKQKNTRRDSIIALLKNPSLEIARTMAIDLQSVTTNRSGLGLLFIIIGENDNHKKKILISRFPADVGILAEENHNTLRVEFLEKVFMRNAHAYKAVVYEGESLDTGFWTGIAVDRQINNGIMAISGYWIREFLQSDFATTPAAGTRRLANALREAANGTDDFQIKEEIAAAVRLAGNINGKTISLAEFGNRFHFSNKTKDAVAARVKQTQLQNDRFRFATDEFQKYLPYKSIELDTGVILTAPLPDFEKFIEKRPIEASREAGPCEYKTTGMVVNERLRKTK